MSLLLSGCHKGIHKDIDGRLDQITADVGNSITRATITQTTLHT